MAGWCRRAFIFTLLAVLFASGSSWAKAEEQKPVLLTIDYGDGMQKRFTGIVWREGMTIADLMDQAAKHPRGIKYVKRGSGDYALLTQIDDIKNGADDKYWTYSVNGKKGDRSYAAMPLKAGDSVLWTFDIYQ